MTTSPLISFLYESIAPFNLIGIVDPESYPIPTVIKFMSFIEIKSIKSSGISS